MKTIITVIVLILATIGSINVYNSETFQKKLFYVMNSSYLQSIGDVVADITHTEKK
jgi:hypothetical protein